MGVPRGAAGLWSGLAGDWEGMAADGTAGWMADGGDSGQLAAHRQKVCCWQAEGQQGTEKAAAVVAGADQSLRDMVAYCSQMAGKAAAGCLRLNSNSNSNSKATGRRGLGSLAAWGCEGEDPGKPGLRCQKVELGFQVPLNQGWAQPALGGLLRAVGSPGTVAERTAQPLLKAWGKLSEKLRAPCLGLEKLKGP